MGAWALGRDEVSGIFWADTNTFPPAVTKVTTGLYINQETVVQFMQWELNRELKASLWTPSPNYRDQITKTSILSLPTMAVTRASHASCCALEWDSAPLSTCRSGDYIQGFRREKEDVIWNCCTLLLCTLLNATLSCSMRWYCMTVARGSSADETIFVSPDDYCPMYYFLTISSFFSATTDFDLTCCYKICR